MLGGNSKRTKQNMMGQNYVHVHVFGYYSPTNDDQFCNNFVCISTQKCNSNRLQFLVDSRTGAENQLKVAMW
jgi:predicted FMN-binding regulatory protein PaiB